jgi:hypothetical protein
MMRDRNNNEVLLVNHVHDVISKGAQPKLAYSLREW